MKRKFYAKLALIEILFLVLTLTFGGCSGCDNDPLPDTDGDGVSDDQDAFPNDPTETTDTDGDGVGDNADAFPNDATETTDSDGDQVGDNADCDDTDALLHTPLKGAIDGDGDGFTVGDEQLLCTAGVLPDGYAEKSAYDDCDDDDAGVYQELGGYLDADEDNYTLGQLQLLCTAGNLPSTYRANQSASDDCDDADPTLHSWLNGYQDSDHDGYTIGDEISICTNGTLPAGYQAAASATDCDDSDPNNWFACNTCEDNDLDLYYIGCDAYTTIDGPDCNDDDENNWISCDSCIDRDLDKHYVACDAYQTIAGPDCDDMDILVNPGASDLPENSVDEDCNGTDLLVNNQKNLFVDSANNCPGSGTMIDPYCTIKDALEAATKGANILIAGGMSKLYRGLIITKSVNLFGGFQGGYQGPGGYNQGPWERSFGSYVTQISPIIDDTQTVIISDGVRVTIEGFNFQGPNLTSGSVTTLTTGPFPDEATVTLVRNSIQGPYTQYGSSTGAHLDGTTILVENSFANGSSTDITRALSLHGNSILINNFIRAGECVGVTGSDGTAAIETGLLNELLLVNNTIIGGNGGRHGFGLALQNGWTTAINNTIRAGSNASYLSAGVSAPNNGSIVSLFNNVIIAYVGEYSYGVSNWSNVGWDAHVVNNSINPGTGTVAIGVRTRGPIQLMNNNIYAPGAYSKLSYYTSSGYVDTDDFTVINGCEWLYCEAGGGNLSADPKFENSMDYSIAGDSPNIDRGVDPKAIARSKYAWYLERDYEDDPRPQDGDGSHTAEWDVGRDEVIP